MKQRAGQAKQLTLDQARKPDGKHGGWRPGAGRPRGRKTVSHEVRATFRPTTPLHVTWRIAEGVRSLRREGVLEVVRAVLAKHANRDDFRVVEFNVLGNHLHFVVEAAGRTALARGMQGLAVRLARAINKVLGRSGKLFKERYHARALTRPLEVRNGRPVLERAVVRRVESADPEPGGLAGAFAQAAAPDCHAALGGRFAGAMKKTFQTTIVRDGSMCFIPVPFDPVPVFGKVRVPVKVTLNGYTYRSTIASMGNGPCLPLRRSNREAAKLEGGETLRVTLELDTEKREVKPPADLVKALKAAPSGWDAWRALSFSHQREHVDAIEEAKKPETRARRIENAVILVARARRRRAAPGSSGRARRA